MILLRSIGAGLALAAGAAAAQGTSGFPTKSDILEKLNSQANRMAVGDAQGGATRGVSVSAGGKAATGVPAQVSVAAPRSGEARVTPASTGPTEPPVVPEGERVELKITFETNSSFIRPGAVGELTALCEALREAPKTWGFNVIGHADAAGGREHNRVLSEKRAREVARYLSNECGVSADRLQIFGLGSSRLLNGVPPVSEANRRVEVSINQI